MTRPRTEQLLEAYVAGAELTDAERATLEALLAQSPAARRDADTTRDLLDALRAAAPEPPPASEAMVRAVRIACAEPMPWPARARRWLSRRAAIAVPVALAAAAAIVVIGLGARAPEGFRAPHDGPSARPPPAPAVVTPAPAPTAPAAPAAPAPAATAVWLDGATTELSALDQIGADAIDQALADELAAIDGAMLEDGDEVDVDGVLPATALGWVDQLDDATAAELDRWLEDHPS